MKPQVNVITIAVKDLQRSLRFYREGLGLPTKGIIGTEFKGSKDQAAGAVVMFELSGDLILALYPRTELAKDANEQIGPQSSTEFSLGYIAESREEVDDILKKAEKAGAELTDAAHERPWGIYSGYFKDPDGHLWEVIYNP
ncbi:MAG TPA: VOC family protein [Thermodesulfovibrionales bacterium]|nr:VOC family protein [Thermodesulfovibrionales bacterium]